MGRHEGREGRANAHGEAGSVTKRVSAHPGELLQCSCLPGVVESQHQDAELFAVLLQVPEEREEPLHTTWATGVGAARGAAPLVRESAAAAATTIFSAEESQPFPTALSYFTPVPCPSTISNAARPNNYHKDKRVAH